MRISDWSSDVCSSDLAVPAMNVRMWHHAATRRNVAQLKADGVHVMEPDSGEMACGEFGKGRLPDPAAIAADVERLLARPHAADPLAGQPDFEAADAPLAGRPESGRASWRSRV